LGEEMRVNLNKGNARGWTVCALLLLLCWAPPLRADWRTYHGDWALRGVASGDVSELPIRIWKFRTEGPLRTAPVVAGGRIFFGGENGRLYAVNFIGMELWARTLEVGEDDARERDEFSAPPIAAGDRVFIGSRNGTLYALEGISGETQWTYDVGGPVESSANWLRASAGGRPAVLVVRQVDGVVHCVDHETGEGIWQSEPTAKSDGPVSVLDDRIVFGNSESALYVLAAETGERLLRIELGEGNQVAGGVAMDGTHAFAGTHSGHVVCADVVTGELVWKARRSKAQVLTTPAVRKGHVIYGSEDGFVYGLNRADGKMKWRFKTHLGHPGSPLIVQSKVVVQAKGELTILRLGSGKVVWSGYSSSDIAAPAITDGLIIAPSDDGTLSAFSERVF